MYLLEFVFNDNTKELIPYKKPDIQGFQEIFYQMFDCEFINNIIECEDEHCIYAGDNVLKFIPNIKLNFSRNEFNGFRRNDSSYAYAKINEFFNRTYTLATIAESLHFRSDYDNVEKILNENIFLYNSFAASNNFFSQFAYINGVIYTKNMLYIYKTINEFCNNASEKVYIVYPASIIEQLKKIDIEIDTPIIETMYVDVKSRTIQLHKLEGRAAKISHDIFGIWFSIGKNMIIRCEICSQSKTYFIKIINNDKTNNAIYDMGKTKVNSVDVSNKLLKIANQEVVNYCTRSYKIHIPHDCAGLYNTHVYLINNKGE